MTVDTGRDDPITDQILMEEEMLRKTAIVIALISGTAFTPVVYAASDVSKAPETATTATTAVDAGMKTADREFGKLSHEGFQAFRNIRMARLAIFDGKTDDAKKLLTDTQSTLKGASVDEASFMKAETDMNVPKAAAKGTPAPAAKPAGEKTSTEPVAWLPIDGQVMLSEDYQVTPEHAGAVAKANDSLKKGDRQAAIDSLKLAGIDMQYAMALLPLKSTVDNVDQAVKEMDGGKYYEANLTLKKVEDALVIDAIDVAGKPETTKAAAADTKTQAAPSPATKPAK